jgi:hypothetical protein
MDRMGEKVSVVSNGSATTYSYVQRSSTVDKYQREQNHSKPPIREHMDQLLTGDAARDIRDGNLVLLAHRQDDRVRRVVLTHDPHLQQEE